MAPRSAPHFPWICFRHFVNIPVYSFRTRETNFKSFTEEVFLRNCLQNIANKSTKDAVPVRESYQAIKHNNKAASVLETKELRNVFTLSSVCIFITMLHVYENTSKYFYQIIQSSDTIYHAQRYLSVHSCEDNTVTACNKLLSFLLRDGN